MNPVIPSVVGATDTDPCPTFTPGRSLAISFAVMPVTGIFNFLGRPSTGLFSSAAELSPLGKISLLKKLTVPEETNFALLILNVKSWN